MSDAPEGSAPGEQPDEDAIELTPEQKAAILRAFDTPEMRARLAGIAQASSWVSGISDDVRRKLISGVALPLADFQTRMTAGIDTTKLMASLQPQMGRLTESLANASAANDALAAQMHSQFGAINSDIFKTIAISQPGLNRIAAELTRNIQATSALGTAMEAFAARQTSWLQDFAVDFQRLRRIFYPPNLREADGITFELVQQVVMVDGIALYGVPRKSVAQALLHADGVAKRREILGRRWKQISADCRDVVESLDDELKGYAWTAECALDALDAGHVEAAQALAATLVDSLLRDSLDDRHKYMPDVKGKRTTSEYDKLSARQFIAFAPIWQAYQQYRTENDDPVPTVFSRHASAHSVSRRQFNRRNAVQGIMLACGLLYHLDEQIAAAAA
ncbi:hypothetical protein ACFUEJ_10710 [Gordonia sp. NPDC057258]|uniref:hypothetical protein n=1 Tax=unclassified Gordonia (in: high G+C Gram-positive bacteria) TaxID=2657482 RepID=UPI00363E2292